MKPIAISIEVNGVIEKASMRIHRKDNKMISEMADGMSKSYFTDNYFHALAVCGLISHILNFYAKAQN